tara:strand:- start:592 stop:987 length:396 start_codon:yes stop_codon:yes gene_type:complete
MKKKTTTRKTIRQIVREEVASAIQEVITELKQPSLSSQKQPIQEKKNFAKNSILNDVLNETASDGEWKTLGGSEFTSDRMNELVGGQYGDMMNKNIPQQVPSSDPMSQFVNKDYREVLQKTEEKQKQKHRR